MDADTTTRKDPHAKLLESFRNHEADILIGTHRILSKDINTLDKNGNKRDLYSKSELQKILFHKQEPNPMQN